MNYDLNFLESKLGKFDREFTYPKISLIEGFLIYIEKDNKEDLKKEINNIKNEGVIFPAYIWGYVTENNSIYLSRSFGENKVFNFNPDWNKKTDFIKSKEKVLKNLDIETINDLFDQKSLFDSFYKKLWYIRIDLAKAIRDQNKIPDNLALMESQHIIDRIIFTYFICEKNLISIEGHGPIKGKILFSDIFNQSENTWLLLKNLFFNHFGRHNTEKLFCGKNILINVPYLNGGLFRPKKIFNISEINLEINFQWSNIFDLLNNYTWIINNDISNYEHKNEGNLTPEIMGHIYEKFIITIESIGEVELEDLILTDNGILKIGNKTIGAYYTPENITQYISKETINPYIYKNLGISSNDEFDLIVKTLNQEDLLKLLEIIKKVKICDCACGSGAFLLKSGEILLHYQIKVLKLLKKDYDKYILIKNIITHNLYGVDLQEGAVEICKLRLWLWLISVSKGNVEPLPNIEYNFLVGNSLVGWDKENLNQNILTPVNELIFTVLEALEFQFPKNKIDNIRMELSKNNMNSYAKAMSLLKELYTLSTKDVAVKLKKIIEDIRQNIYDQINNIYFDDIKSKKVKISYEEYLKLNPFHWKVDFYDIFLNGGFDLIIGNPPYVRNESIDKSLKLYLSKYYETYFGSSDLYVYFFEKGLKLLKYNGNLSYICSNKFLKTKYGKNLRKFLINYQIKAYIDFTGKKVFENATVDVSIFLIKKCSKKNEILVNNEFFLNQKILTENVWVFEREDVLTLMNKIESNGIELNEIDGININSGIKTGLNSVFVINEKNKEELINLDRKNKSIIKPLIRGNDVFKWKIQFNNEYLIDSESGTNIQKDFPILYDYFEPFKEKLENRSEIGKFWYNLRDCKYYNDFLSKKIVWSDISREPSFTVDKDNYFLLNTNYFLSTHNKDYPIYYLVGILNSDILYWYFKRICSTLGDTGFRYTKQFVKQLPIPNADKNIKENIIKLSKNISDLYINSKSNEAIELEWDLNRIIYELFNLTEDEIDLIKEELN